MLVVDRRASLGEITIGDTSTVAVPHLSGSSFPYAGHRPLSGPSQASHHRYRTSQSQMESQKYELSTFQYEGTSDRCWGLVKQADGSLVTVGERLSGHQVGSRTNHAALGTQAVVTSSAREHHMVLVERWGSCSCPSTR